MAHHESGDQGVAVLEEIHSVLERAASTEMRQLELIEEQNNLAKQRTDTTSNLL